MKINTLIKLLGIFICLVVVYYLINIQDDKHSFRSEEPKELQTSEFNLSKIDNVSQRKVYDAVKNECGISESEDLYNVDDLRDKVDNKIKALVLDIRDVNALDYVSLYTLIPREYIKTLYARSRLESKSNKANYIPRFAEYNWQAPSARDVVFASTLTESSSVMTIAEKIREGQFQSNTFFQHPQESYSGMLPMLSLLHAKGVIRSGNIDVLLNAGLDPLVADLAYFTAKGFDKETLYTLAKNTNGNLNGVYIFNGGNESLASLALESGNFQALSLWLELGSTINPDPLFSSFPKKLVENKNKFTQSQLKRIFSMVRGLKLTSSDISLLSEIFGHDVSNEFSDFKEVDYSDFVDTGDFAIAVSFIRGLYKDIVPNFKFDLDNSSCINEVALNVIYPLFFDERIKPRHASEKIIYTDMYHQKQQDLLIDDVWLKILASKLEEEKNLEQSLKIEIDKIKESENIDENGELFGLMSEVIALSMRGDWNAALDELKKIHGDDVAADALLFIALQYANSSDPIRMLMQKGATLPKEAHSILITNENLNVIKELAREGVDILGQKSATRPDLAKQIVRLGTPEKLSFYLESGLTVDTQVEGFDAVDEVLNRFSLSGNDPVFLDLLIKSGVTVEASHIAFTKRLESTSPLEYEYIQERFPELIN